MIRKYYILAGFFVFIFLSSKLYAQLFTPEEQEILTLQDKRTLGENNKLLGFLSSPNTSVQVRALNALANIGDTTTAEAIGNLLLSSNDTDARSIAAFALGQIPCAVSIDYLSRALIQEKEENVLTHIFDALSRVGDETSYTSVLNYSTSSEKLNEAIALSIARYGIRKVRNADGAAKLISLANSNSPDVSRMCAYAFARGMDKPLLEPHREQLKNLASTNDPLTRMWAIQALGRIADPQDVDFLISKYSAEPDWKVKVNILNALPAYKVNNPSVLELYISQTRDENIYISISAFNSAGRLYSSLDPKELPEELKNMFTSYFHSRDMKPPQVLAEAISSYALIYKDASKDEVFPLLVNSDNFDIKAASLRAVGNFSDGMVYKTIRDTVSYIVQEYNKAHPNTTGAMIGSPDLAKLYGAFVDMLAELDDKVGEDDRNNIRLMFSEFSSSRDPYITAASLTALTDSMYLKYRDETAQVMLFDFKDLSDKDNPDVTQIFIETFGELGSQSAVTEIEGRLNSPNYEIARSSAAALKKITGKDYDVSTQRYSDYDWAFLNSLSKDVYINMETSQGNIKLKLYPDVAPFTVMSILKLVQNGYFSNTIFHRVIPNFVIQGGDPTGTGFSGPGYSIRSEFSPLSFTTGILGMASSGKDTEGSQFFITHSPQYHLDGKYTIFGEVTEGMDVVNKIYIGDVLLNIK